MQNASATATNLSESETLRQHRAMYERRLRELARIAPRTEELSEETLSSAEQSTCLEIASV